MDEPEDKGYTVKDRRYLHMSEEEKAQAQQAPPGGAAPEGSAAGAQAPQDVPLPGITFSSFIMSLSSSIFMSLGIMPDPNTGKADQNLPLAKQTIDLLGLLREKTRGNLTADEENLFDHLLYDLRMAYVKEAR
jgi:hypothetical protein